MRTSLSYCGRIKNERQMPFFRAFILVFWRMVTIDAIHDARTRIAGGVFETPCTYSETLSAQADNQVYLKFENLQRTGSFKDRGALNKILTLTDVEKGRGVIAASAGNHAQAVSYHAAKRGIRVQICMPLATPLVKVSSTKNYGGEVVLAGDSFDEAVQEAQRRREQFGFTLVHAFDDEAVIAGQGTIGLELLEQVPMLDAVVVPVGGGGIVGGIACAIKHFKPNVHVIGVQTSRVPSMIKALEAHHPFTVPAASTIADGIAVRCAGRLTLPLVESYVDEMVTVEEEEIANAILVLLEREKTLAEGAGAAGVAALLQRKTSLEGKVTVVLICGGNIDVTVLSRIIERGLVKDGRLVRLQISIADRPGGLKGIIDLVAKLRANVVDLKHERAYFGVHLGETMVDIMLETRGSDHIAELTRALEESHYPYHRVL
jgi:threonine dehydratase